MLGECMVQQCMGSAVYNDGVLHLGGGGGVGGCLTVNMLPLHPNQMHPWDQPQQPQGLVLSCALIPMPSAVLGACSAMQASSAA